MRMAGAYPEASRLWTLDSCQRFTEDGSDELEGHLRQICDQVRDGVRAAVPAQKLEALLLGGGYGRGEGGVCRTESGDWPYNDLEFYVFLRGSLWLNERRHQARLQALAKRLSTLPAPDPEIARKMPMLAGWKPVPPLDVEVKISSMA